MDGSVSQDDLGLKNAKKNIIKNYKIRRIQYRGPFKTMSRLKGRGVRWGVTKCDRGGGSFGTCDVTLVKKFYNTFYHN